MRLARTNLARRKDSAVPHWFARTSSATGRSSLVRLQHASLFLHHLSDQGILTLMDHLRRFVRRSVLISDLRRGAGNYLGWLLAGLHLPQKVRHDTLLSVRRGFTAEELRRWLGAIPGEPPPCENRLGLIQALVRFWQRWESTDYTDSTEGGTSCKLQFRLYLANYVITCLFFLLCVLRALRGSLS